jgi:uncharacterized protein YndB with AHSA1/START domain
VTDGANFAQPIEEVWRAITDSRMLALWLMENDFEASIGARFVLRQADPAPWWRGWVDCEGPRAEETHPHGLVLV